MKPILYFLSLLCFSFGHAQRGKQITFSQLSVNDGLSQNSVVSIAQDSTGYLYFATQDGLNKYNGLEFEYFPLLFEDITKENYSKLGKVFIDSKNELFAVTTGGQLQRYIQESKSFKPITGIEEVSSVYEDHLKNFWIGTYGSGLYKIDTKSGDTINTLRNELALLEIYAISEYNEQIVVGASGGILILTPKDASAPRFINHKGVNFSSFTKAQNALWLGSYGHGLFFTTELEGLQKFTGFSNKTSLPADLNIQSLLTDSKGRIWIGTYGDGAWLIDFSEEKIQHFFAQPRNPKAIHYNDVLSILEDYTGTIWLGTDGAGLSYYDENLSKFSVLTNYQTPEFANIDVIRAITKDPNGNLWLGSSGKGLTTYNPSIDKYRSYLNDPNDPNSIASNRVMSLLADENELWIGFQDEGLSLLRGNGNFKRFTSKSNPKLEVNTVWCIFKDSKSRIWLGTRDEGLIQFDKNKGIIKQYLWNPNNSNSISSNNIRSIIEANDGNLWIGTENNGLNKLFVSEGKFKRYTQPEISNIKSLFEVNNKLWIGTNGNGLQALSLTTDKIRGFTSEDGLPNNVIYGILSDTEDNLWLSSNRGITKFSLDEHGKTVIVNYDIFDGLQALEFNTGAYYKDSEGTLYFGGLKGINWLDPTEITNNTRPPKTIIYKLDLFNDNIPLDSGRVFNSNENTLSFTFAGLHFSQPERNHYQYILENYETNWSLPSTNNFAHYTNLESGDYTFKVISSNYDGVWDTTPASYNFTIKRPWYLSTLAILGYILAGLLLLYSIYFYFKWRWKMELKLKLEHQETERLQKLDELKSKLYTNISHEFRTPLTLISGPVQQLLNSSGLEEKDKKSLTLIENSSQRMLRLVNQMLDLSRLEEGEVVLHVTKNELKPHLLQIIEAFQLPAKEKGISIRSDIADFTDTWYDKDIMDKILFNLMSNAIKYAPDNSEVNCKVLNNGGEVYIQLENENTTIRHADMHKLFKRFHQNDRNTPGAGIGLSLVKELVTLCNGRVWGLKESPNKISFQVTLPVSKQAYNSNVLEKENIVYNFTDEDVQDLVTSDMELPVLLVVEDNEELRTYIASLFVGMCETLEAKDGAEGIKMALSKVPDIILSDIMMPEKDGMELTDRLKNDVRTSHIPIILLTAKQGDSNELKGLSTKADDYITKPFNAEILRQKVRNCLDARAELRKRYSQHTQLKPKDIAFTNIDEQLLEDIQVIIDTRITEPEFSASPFAKELGLSRMQLHRKLKALTGLSTSEFIRSQRLKSATKLMETSDRSISEIAYSVGFNSPSYFIKCFKEAYGVTPTDFVKNA